MGNEHMIDLNKASVEILETLRGVGRAKAEAIVALRKIVGSFEKLEDILVIPGIGKNILEINEGVLYLNHHPIRRSLRKSTKLSNSSEALSIKRSSLRVRRKVPYSSRSITKSRAMINSSTKEPEVSPTKNSSTARLLSTKTDSSSSKQLEECLKQNKEKEEIDLHCNEEDPNDDDDDFDDDDDDVLDEDEEEDGQFNDMLFDFPDDDVESDEHTSWPMPLGHGNLSNISNTLDECDPSSPRLKHLSDSVDGPSRVFIQGPGTMSDSKSATLYTNIIRQIPLYNNLMKLKTSGVGSLGTDTPHDETLGDIPLDVHMSPMRLTDGEIESEGQDTSESERMAVDDLDVLSHDKKQNKRKSELCSDSRGTCPVKKSCKDIDTNLICERLKSSVVMQSQRQPPRGLKSWLSKFQSWTPAQKILALNSLIDICDLSQVRHIHQIILPQFQRDFISLLPKELALYVLSFLDPKDLLRAAQTCKYWNILAADNLLWREKCREDGLEDHLGFLNARRKKGTSISHMSPYKSAYMRQHRIEMNWRTHPLKPPRILKGHDDHVITCLQFSGNTVVSGSDDNTLKVWNATSGKCVRTLTGHTGGVWSSQMAGNTIVSGSTDRMLRVWNAETGECKYMLYGHTSTVRCLHLHGEKVVSGSRDATLRIWDVKTGTCERVLMGHVAAVRCVQYNGKLVVSGAYDYMVKVWNPDREECLHTLEGHTNRVYSLQFDGIHVVSGSLDTSIRVWDVDSGQCKHTLMGHQSLTSGMELKNNILISGNADSTVKVWDILTGQCLQTLSGSNKHRSAVTCLQFNQKFVVTSSDDGTVKLWDVKTGQFIRNLVALDSGGSGGVVWRIRASDTKLVCAVGSRNGTEETKLLVLDFDVPEIK